MGYLFAIGVVALWMLTFHSMQPFLAYYVGPVIIGIIIFRWIRSKIDEHELIAKREQLRRQELLGAVTEFRALNVKFVGNESSAVLSFESELDAELAASTHQGAYFNYARGYVVLTRTVTAEQVKVCEKYLAYALQTRDSSADPEISRLNLNTVPESERARDLREERKAHLLTERARIKHAMLLDVEQRKKADFPDLGATAVYVFASQVACKVGFSDDPEKRLRQVQTGHPAPLRIVKTWWFASMEEAARVEKHVHSRLKVLGVHASGEWFSAPQSTVIENVRKAISELTTTKEIDDSLRALGGQARDGLESTLAKLVSLPWKMSRKGNEWLQFGEDHVVIFKSRGRYSFRYKDKFSDEKFLTKADAKAAAFHQLLQNVENQKASTSAK